MSDKKKYMIKDDKSLGGFRVEERDDVVKGRKYTIINDDGRLGGKKIVKRNNGGMSKDRLTQKDVEAAKYQRADKDRLTQKDIEAAEKKSGGGFIIGKGGDYIKDLL